MKRGDVVRVNVAAFWMENEIPEFEYGILVEDYEPVTKFMRIALFSDKIKTFHAGAVQKAGRQVEFKGTYWERKAMADRSRYKIGDLLVTYPISDHIGIVIKVEEDFYKTSHGRMNRITIHCETMEHKTFYLPEVAVDTPFGGEPGWVKPDEYR